MADWSQSIKRSACHSLALLSARRPGSPPCGHHFGCPASTAEPLPPLVLACRHSDSFPRSLSSISDPATQTQVRLRPGFVCAGRFDPPRQGHQDRRTLVGTWIPNPEQGQDSLRSNLRIVHKLCRLSCHPDEDFFRSFKIPLACKPRVQGDTSSQPSQFIRH